MRAARGTAFILLALASACGREEPAASAPEPTAQQLREERCTAFAEDAARTARITGVALEAALTDRSQWTAQTGQKLAGIGGEVGRELLEKCMQWPDDVIDCLGLFGVLKSGCDEKLAGVLGVAEPGLAADIPAGPAQAWRLTLPEKPTALAVLADGTVVAIVDRQLLAARTGALAWQALENLRGWLVVTGDTILVATTDRIVAVDPAAGHQRWSVALPPIAGAEEYDAAAKAEIATLAADGLWIGDSEARFFRVNPDHCARSSPTRTAAGCLTPAGALVDETLDSDARLTIDAGRRALHEFGVVRMFDEQWTTTLTARARDYLGAAALGPAGLALVVDEDVVLLDPARCTDRPFAPSGWPQPGQLYIRGSDECSDCVAPPPGCRLWRMFVEGVANEVPVLGDDGLVVVNAGQHTLALRDGAEVWRTVTAGGGRLVRAGDGVIGVSTGLGEDTWLGLFELDLADGAHRWRVPLGLEIPESSYYSGDITLTHDDGWIVAGYRESIAVFKRPGA